MPKTHQPDQAEAVVVARLLAAGGKPRDVAPLLRVTPKHVRRTVARALDARETAARDALDETAELRAALRLTTADELDGTAADGH